MPTPDALLARLDAIGASLAATGRARALIGLGSVGLELDRLDEFSDLDFFVIVQDGSKTAFLADLGWLAAPAPLVYQVRNTADGYKALADDGIFYEFAVFEAAELAEIPFAPGRIVWRDDSVGDEIARPALARPEAAPHDLDWLVGEALTNLYVGLGRFHRGERLSALRFVQGYAVDRVLDIVAAQTAAAAGHADVFAPERRAEQRFPELAAQLATFLPGYAATPAAALAILDFLESRVDVSPALAAAIRALCAR